MAGRRYGLRIKYRMKCKKSDSRNICYDAKNPNGFYWLDVKNDVLQEQLNKMGIHDKSSLEEIQLRLECVSVPEGCEAVMADLTIYLPGSTGANGTLRRNVTFEYFRDFTNNTSQVEACSQHSK